MHAYRKERSEYFDPCQEAAQLSIKCLHRNAGDKSFCGDYFQFVLPYTAPSDTGTDGSTGDTGTARRNGYAAPCPKPKNRQ